MAKNKKQKKNKPTKEKKSLKEYFRRGDIEIPACIMRQITKLYMVAAGVLLVGVVLTVLAFDVLVAVATILIPLGIALFAYYKEISLSRDGFVVIEGECVKVEYTLSSQALGTVTRGLSKDIPSRFLIHNEEGTFAIPYFKQNTVIDEGDRVRLYVGNNTKLMDVRGALTPEGILGYEIVY